MNDQSSDCIAAGIIFFALLGGEDAMHKVGDVGVRHRTLRDFRCPYGTREFCAGRPGFETPGLLSDVPPGPFASTFGLERTALLKMLWEAKTVPEGPLIAARQFTGG